MTMSEIPNSKHQGVYSLEGASSKEAFVKSKLFVTNETTGQTPRCCTLDVASSERCVPVPHPRHQETRVSPGRCGAFNMKPITPGMKHFLQQKPSLTSKLLGAVLGGFAGGHDDFDM